MEKLITLAVINDLLQVRLIENLLKGHGISCFSLNDFRHNKMYITQTYYSSPVELTIDEKDLSEARELLEEGGFGGYLA